MTHHSARHCVRNYILLSVLTSSMLGGATVAGVYGQPDLAFLIGLGSFFGGGAMMLRHSHKVFKGHHADHGADPLFNLTEEEVFEDLSSGQTHHRPLVCRS